MPLNSAPSAMTLAAACLLLAVFSAAPVTAETEMPSESSPAALRPRVRVASNAEETDIRDCLNSVVEAANSENLDRFCDCFTGSKQAKIRKQAAIRFVQHDVAMELLDAHIIKAGKTSAEVAVKYRVVLSDDRFDVVSLVVVKQENGYWRIRSEKIQSYEHQSPSMCSPSRYACLGGTCHLAANR
jgi:type III secretory pathway component EscR